jgi:aspartate carbamoyltransferase catalytic subunit
MNHIIKSQQFSKEFILDFLRDVQTVKNNPKKFNEALKGKVVATLFYEPSTRTRLSFESAAQRLGASIISTENAREFSSASKGESLQDSIRTVNGYADFIILRHYENDASDIATTASNVPIINAGSGSGQHPTQALLDIFTIYEQFNRLSNLHITFVGDLQRGRTVNSLVYLLSLFEGNSFTFVSPENCKIKKGIKDHLEEQKCTYTEKEDIQVIKDTDIVYMTRVQKERFDDPKEYEKAKGKFVLTSALAKEMKKESIIMHPLPRVDEIEVEVDTNPRALYFKQAANGLYVRMALLKMLNENR